MSDANGPFERDYLLDKPGIIGARWWHKGLIDADRATSRRTALKTLAIATVAIGGIGAIVTVVTAEDYAYSKLRAIAVQRTYGWNFGAPTEVLVFNGNNLLPFDPGTLGRLAQDLTPVRFLAFHVPTLLQSPTATPSMRPAEETQTFVPLSDVLRPIFTYEMDRAFQRGVVFGGLFRGRNPRTAVVVDLPGPESVAFAAGAAGDLEPVSLLDNWPHPRGVVAAHLALAAVTYYQPLFARQATERTATALPLFMLDRYRLSPYIDEATSFDNRYTATIPSAAALRAMGIVRLLYVIPNDAGLPELDDLNDAFNDLVAGGVEVRAVSADLFATWDLRPPENFWADYGWLDSEPAEPSSSPMITGTARGYQPARRATVFSHGARPADFGLVNVVLAAGTAAVLGAGFDRRGSWNRSSGGWGG